jgi:hypothetical protein
LGAWCWACFLCFTSGEKKNRFTTEFAEVTELERERNRVTEI